MRPVLCLAAALMLAGCAAKPPEPPKTKTASTKSLKDGPMPDTWHALFDTSQGSFVLEIHKDWSPIGAERFWKLVNSGYFDNSRFFRVRPNFIAQFGLAADPQVTAMFNASPIDDDPGGKQKNLRGTISFAQSGKRSRRAQVFVNLKDNTELDRDGFTPFGRVSQGMDVFEKLYSAYGEWDPPGRGPNVNRMQTQGNAYLDVSFPKLDKIIRAKAVR